MSFSIEYLNKNFKKCYEEALAAKESGNLPLARRKLNDAAEYMDKLAMGASGDYRQKYSENAKRLRQLAESIHLPENAVNFSPSANNLSLDEGSSSGDSMGSVQNSPENSSTGMEEFFQILGKDELKFGFEGVVGLDEAKAAVTEYLINPMRYPEAYNYNFLDNQGILLEGPPGTGKTTFAKAVAKEIGSAFALIKTSELINCYIGATGKNIDRIFSFLRNYVKRNNTSVIVFIDEFEEISKKRTSDDKTSAAAVPALLRNLDGVESNKNLFILANTNLVELLDPALVERFRRVIYIPLPDLNDRKKLFMNKLSEVESQFLDKLDFDRAAQLSEGLGGRHITFLCDDFKRKLSEIKAKLIKVDDINDLLAELITVKLAEKARVDKQ